MQDIIDDSIKTLRLAAKLSAEYYYRPLVIAYSGGKDSDVLLDIARRSDIDFEVVHSHTTADAPDTVYHVREVFERMKNEGIKATIVFPMYKGGANKHVGFDTTKIDAAYKNRKILL